jgi:hypothetical protein
MSGQGAGMGAGRDTGMTLVLDIDRVDADGSSHAKASLQGALIPKKLNVTFEGTIAASGAINLKFDPNLQPQVGESRERAESLGTNAAAYMMQQELSMSNFNAFADGCAQHELSTGATWSAPMDMPPGVDVRYSVTGREQRVGRDVFAVTMQSEQNPMGSLSGVGYYDPVAHLVVTLHAELKSTNYKSSMTTDISLAQI